MKIYSVAELIGNWAEVLRACQEGEHILISRHSKIVVALIPFEDAKKKLYTHGKPTHGARTSKLGRVSDRPS
jgi:prevent-host-death family protein